MEWLQKILSNAVYTQDGKLDVEATMKKINEEASKHIVPKEQYNNKVKELDAANNTIKQLEKDAKDNPDLQKAIKDHEVAMKKLQNESVARFMNFNPMYHFITLFRTMLNGATPSLSSFAVCYLFSAISLIAGILFFRYLRPKIAAKL